MMHKLTKGLKKKKKQKKGKKGEDDEEFDPEELERYRQKKAEQEEALRREAEASGADKPAGENEEWKKFAALTSGIDTVLKKTQDDLDRIKSTSFYQKKVKEPEPDPEEAPEVIARKKELAKRFKGFDKDGNPIEITSDEEEDKVKPLPVNEDGLVIVPDDDEDHEDSAEEDIFDTTYLDELQNIEVQLAYIPDSPTQEELGDDPFDTTNADKVLKVVDKTGKKLVSLGNAVEVLAGRVDQVSTCKIGKNRPRPKPQDLLDIDAEVPAIIETAAEDAEPVEIEKTLLDDDSDIPDIPIDLTQIPAILTRPHTPAEAVETKVDVSEFEIFPDKTLLDEVPTLDDEEFDLEAPADLVLEEAEDPFAEKEPETLDLQNEIVEVAFEAATFVNEDDPFDTTIAENIVPGKTELKFIEKELESVSISLTDPAGLHRNYETGLLNDQSKNSLTVAKKDLLGGSVTDLSQLADKPIQPVEEISYVDPFDTSNIRELPPGKTELKVLEKELLGESKKIALDDLDDDDFDPRAEEPVKKAPPPRPATTPTFNHVPEIKEDPESNQVPSKGRKPSRPEALEIAPKVVAFELPNNNNNTDFLAANEEEKSLPAKPLTPYYPQKSIEEVLPPEEEVDEADVDPFDTSYVASPAPCKTELKIIESELLRENQAGSDGLADDDFDPRSEKAVGGVKVVNSSQVIESLIQENKRKAFGKRQDSILDTAVEVNREPLAPNVKPIEEEFETTYVDPFDTSHATNIGPGKVELKLLENELSQVPDPQPIRIHPVIEQIKRKNTIEEDPDFDPREGEPKQKDILCLDTQEEIADKILTPIQDTELEAEDIDPFDTSFASIGPGKTELKLLESELIDK